MERNLSFPMAPSTRGGSATAAMPASCTVGSVPDVLSDLEKEHFTNVAKHMTQALLAATNLSQAMPWKLVYDKPFSIYRTELCGLGPCNVHAVTKLVAHIDEVTDALITTSTNAYKSMMTTLGSDFVDGAVLANILTPTTENPFRYVGLKWAAFKGSVMSKDKDFILLEYVDMIEDAHGKKTAFRVMQSVDVPSSVDASSHHSSGRYTREHVPLVGFIYHTTGKKGELRMTYTCNMDTKGDLPIWAANSAIQSHVDKCITRTLKYIEVQRVLQDEGGSFDLPQRVIPMSGNADYCHVCEKKFKTMFRPRYSCLKCAKYVCSNCYSFRTASVPELGERLLRVCTVCVVQVRQARRGSSDLHKKESLDRLSLACEDARQKRQTLDEVLNSVRHMITTDYKLFSSHDSHRGISGKFGVNSRGIAGNIPNSITSQHGGAGGIAMLRRRVTVGPQELTPALEMFKDGLPSLMLQQQQTSAVARGQPKQTTPDKRRSTVGPGDLKSSLAAFHHDFRPGKLAAATRHREDEVRSDNGSMCLSSSDSEDDDDDEMSDHERDDLEAEVPPRRGIQLTESALNLHQKRSKELEKQSEAIHKLANSLARQYSDSQQTSVGSHSRKSSLDDLMPMSVSVASSSVRKASTNTIVLFDMDETRDLERLQAFQHSTCAKRRSSGPELFQSSHPPSSCMF
ncbi:hypothetical protein H310_08723 [Aphanomyces invadans]|uniref:FYVE-type domain-containing protein n=1 Tax=Aphanomyces invadans TaxID=157072 RepID=A0A024TWQ8_9STRA|nr:hypothetical protein H310_08723 [Aphanomyces invadans]ETV98605.1 hypothetical protein H310_08723 [Aphanomyces invadans]|eukprot:XP_008872802.1 hypothetical protein H310_08723 [Aphanomyces invadans]